MKKLTTEIFTDNLRRRHGVEKPETFRGSLADAYRSMATDEAAAIEAREWSEGLIGDTLSDEDIRA
jgi:hypothetical protein